ncbi:hypothetical protein H8356DRAFT_1430462 [Neocallimastix lanati (nom. inval.)]|nr:hypothetical protein H8356DRAFT_1430462 [Neocallimastix sp. JGI-2020a]
MNIDIVQINVSSSYTINSIFIIINDIGILVIPSYVSSVHNDFHYLVLRPTWYEVSFCNNNTLVNSLGLYFDITNEERNTENNNTIIFHGKNTLLESNYEMISMILTSVTSRFNPCHKINIRLASGRFIKIKEDFKNLPSNISKYSSIRACKGHNVVCSAIITSSFAKQYSITDNNGTSEGLPDMETQDISNTMEIANSLIDSRSITQIFSNSIIQIRSVTDEYG